MKFNLSKNQVFEGAIYLRYIAVIFAFIQCCCASLKDVPVNTEEQLNHLTLILETRFHVSSKTFTRPGHKCAEWIQQDLYKDSIFVVIPEAIADCALKFNEFQEEKINNGVIKFEDTIPDNYTPENWNAVVLYNLIYFAFQYKQKGIRVENSDGVINKFFDEYIFNRKIEQIYGGAYKENIERAFADIKQYSNELDLINYITNNEHFNEIYKTSQICVDYDKNGRARVTINNNKLYSKGLIYKIDGKTSYNDIEQIEIGIERNKIKNILLYDIYAIRYGEIDSYMNIKRGKVYEYYVYPYMNILSNQNCWQALQRLNNGSQIRYISLYPQKELREEGINVGWYLDSDEVYHLAWITKDDVYPKQSWVNPGDIKINIGYPKSYTGKEYTIKIDPQCIRDLTIEDYGDRIKKIDITAGDSLSAYDILDFEKLVTNSDSIRRFDTKLYLYGWDELGNLTSATKINKIFDNNKNLEYTAQIHSLTEIDASTMFVNNPKLQPVEVKIDNEEEANRNLGSTYSDDF